MWPGRWPDDDLAAILLQIQRDLFVVGAELATGVENRSKLTDEVSRVTPAMVEALEAAIDGWSTRSACQPSSSSRAATPWRRPWTMRGRSCAGPSGGP